MMILSKDFQSLRLLKILMLIIKCFYKTESNLKKDLVFDNKNKGVFMENIIIDNLIAVQIREIEKEIEKETALELITVFMPFFEQTDEWAKKAKEILVTDISQIKEMGLAREARLGLKDIRVEVEKKRKVLKEESLRKGKAIDGMANIIKFLIIPIEEHLQEQEDFVKRQEEKRKSELVEKRKNELLKFEIETGYYNLADMSEEGYSQILETSRLVYKQKQETLVKAEQEKIAKEKAEAEERERIKLENEQLKKEALERERLAKIQAEERIKLETERQAREKKEKEAYETKLKKERAEKAKLEAELKAKQAEEEKKKLIAEARIRKEKEAYETKLKKERAEKAKLEAELKAKQAEEEKKKLIAEARIRKEKEERDAKLAPDKMKL